MIQQIAQSNPNLAQYLEQNPEALLQLLGAMGGEGGLGVEGEGGEGAGALPPGTHVLQVTPEERAAIERVCCFCLFCYSYSLMCFKARSPRLFSATSCRGLFRL